MDEVRFEEAFKKSVGFITLAHFSVSFDTENKNFNGNTIAHAIARHLYIRAQQGQPQKPYERSSPDEVTRRAMLQFVSVIETYNWITLDYEIEYGSITIKDGEIKIGWKPLVILLAFGAAASNFVLNYSEYKKEIGVIKADVTSLVGALSRKADYSLKRCDFEFPSDEEIFDNLNAILRDEEKEELRKEFGLSITMTK